MAIWVGEETRLLLQGITGKEGEFHALGCRDYGRVEYSGIRQTARWPHRRHVQHYTGET